MADLPGHTLPNYSDAARDDALFHYTTANGLIGIISKGQIWNTAYYCANDESELATGRGVLSPLFGHKTAELIKTNDPRVGIFARRGIHISDYANNYEHIITSFALSSLCAYITCFCMAAGEEDFLHGLLSQWRGYGADGGYALQFSRKKLVAAIEAGRGPGRANFDLQDVYYSPDNPLKTEVLRHKDDFVTGYLAYLDNLALDQDTPSWNPMEGIVAAPLEALLNYLVHTKNHHFSEERECRLSTVQLIKPVPADLPVKYYSRGGMLVPYTENPREFLNVLECVEWIVVGPGPRMSARFKAAAHLVKTYGLDIKIRCSHIPFSRL